MNKVQKFFADWMGIKGTQPVHNGPINMSPMRFVEGRLVTIEDNQLSYINSGYNINDIIYSIVGLIMDKVRVAPWDLYKVIDESSLKQYKGLMSKKDISASDFIKAKDYRKKALEPVKANSRIKEILQYPNEQEGFSDFVANDGGYLLLTGNSYVKNFPLQAGANTGQIGELYHLPAQWVSIFATSTFPARVTGYNVQTWNLNYPPEEILHNKKWDPNWNIQGQQLYGMSPLKAALALTNRNNSANRVAAALFQNQGTKGVIYMDEPTFDIGERKAQAKAVKELLHNEYTGEDTFGKIASSGFKMGYVPIGLTAVELAIIESEKWDLRRFCNIYGISSQMLNDPENKTYNNEKTAAKELTTRAALPILTSFRNNFNRKLQSNWGGKEGEIVDFDMTVYTELQEDVGEMMKWLDPLMNHGFPMNRALELLNIEQIDAPEFDEPWITPGMGQPLSEWQMGVVDDVLNPAVDANGNLINQNGKPKPIKQ